MNRHKDPVLRQQLLERAVQYVLAHGVGGLSLRPLAQAIGTSARMLIHHFGSKQALIAAVLSAIERGFEQRTADLRGQDRSIASTLTHLWGETGAAQMERALRATFELWGHALVHPEQYATFLASLTQPLIERLQHRFELAGHTRAEALVRATLAVAAFQGLQLVRLTSGNGRRREAALRLLLSWLEPTAARPTRPIRRRRTP
jgi:AcrR family transcriptional regulator